MQLELLKCRQAAEQSCTAPGDNAFFNGCACSVHCVFDTSFLLFQLGFRGCADFDHRDPADQFGQTLLQLFLVVIGGGVFDLHAQLLDSALDLARLAGTGDDRGIVLVDGHLLGASEVLQFHILELDTEIFGDGLAASENCDVFEHCFAAVAEARSLDGSALQCAAQLVHHQSREGFAFNVLGDDQQRLAHFGRLLEQRQ